MSFFAYTKILADETPIIDRIAIPASIAAAFTVAHIQSAVTIAIGLITVATMIPRMFIAWHDWSKRRSEAKNKESSDG